jgi:hypothetical protein
MDVRGSKWARTEVSDSRLAAEEYLDQLIFLIKIHMLRIS